jgi:hypothetical protein
MKTAFFGLIFTLFETIVSEEQFVGGSWCLKHRGKRGVFGCRNHPQNRKLIYILNCEISKIAV